MTTDTRLHVAFDLTRVADRWHRPYPVFGITRYARTLFEALRERTDAIRVTPAVFAPVDHPNLFFLDATVRQMKRSLGADILTSWRRRPSWWARTYGRLERAAAQAMGPDIARDLSHRVLRYTGLERSLFQPTPHPLPVDWAVYHSPYGPLPPVEWTGAAARILTVHDCIPYKFPHFYPGIPPPILESINIETDCVICYSESTRSDVVSIVGIADERVGVIPLTHQPLFASPRREKACSVLAPIGVAPGRYVLALGQPNPRKNTKMLAQSFHRATADEKFQDYRLVLVSPTSYRQELVTELEKSGVPMSSFEVLVDVDDETLAGLYACAAAFAFVSLYEGFGLPPLEAMAAGCPVVVSETSSLPEVVGDAGQYVDPTSCESIAAGLRRVLEDQSLRESMVIRGRRRAGEFSWERTTTMTIEFYQHALADAQRQRRG